MKDRFEFSRFAPWDAAGMAAHLQQMEARGWRLRGINWLGLWQYEPCTPAAVRYAVTYAPSRRNWRLMPTEQEQDLEDLCVNAGWTKLAAVSRFHIYRNDAPTATALETEELVRLDNLSRTLLPDMTISALGWTLASVLWTCSIVKWLLQDPPEMLATQIPTVLAFTIWIFLENMVPWLMLLPWLRSARKAAKAGRACPPVRFWRVWKNLSRFLMTLLFLLLIAGDPVMVVVYGILYGIFGIVRHLLSRKQEDPEEIERKYQNLLFFFFVAIFIANIFFRCIGIFHTEPVPLSMSDLGVTGQITTTDLEHNRGLLAYYHRYQQIEDATGKRIFVTWFDRYTPILASECDAWFRDYFTNGSEAVVSCDPAPWSAEAVYSSGDVRLICYEDRIVTLYTSWSLSDAELIRAAEVLAP